MGELNVHLLRKIICMGVLPVYHFHAWYPEARKVGCEPPCQYWELSLELKPPQEEKPVLLTAMPSLQPQISPFLISHTRDCMPAP